MNEEAKRQLGQNESERKNKTAVRDRFPFGDVSTEYLFVCSVMRITMSNRCSHLLGSFASSSAGFSTLVKHLT
jgi:hypothetical protein